MVGLCIKSLTKRWSNVLNFIINGAGINHWIIKPLMYAQAIDSNSILIATYTRSLASRPNTPTS